MHEPPSLPTTSALPKVDATVAMPDSWRKRARRLFVICLIIFIASMADLTTADFRSKVAQTTQGFTEKLPGADVISEWTAPIFTLAEQAKNWVFNTAWYFIFDKEDEDNAA